MKEVLTLEDIQNAVKLLKESDKEFIDNLMRHYQHKKKERRLWAENGCPECLHLYLNTPSTKEPI